MEIWTGIAAQNPSAADRMLRRIEARLEILEELPEAGAPRPDIGDGARMLVERPYIILYRLRGDRPQVVRVLHGARYLGGMVAR